MKKHTTFYLLILIFVTVTSLLSIQTVPARAQTSTPTPSAAPTAIATSVNVTPTPTVVVFTDPNVVTFSQLQKGNPENLVLKGPFDAGGFGFTIPANWKLSAGTELDVKYSVSFNTGVLSNPNVVVTGGGALSILLNNQLLQTIPLSKTGEDEIRFTIPSSAFESQRNDDLNVLWFSLESYDSCDVVGESTTVYIYPTSFLTLPHSSTKPSTDLLNFPRPIYQNSFSQDSALIVVPDQPSQAELQAALTTAAGFGKLSQNNLLLDLTTISGLKNKELDKNHLIFVGSSSSLPDLSGLNLPLPVTNGKFQIPDEKPDAGIVEMVDSPWSDGPHVVLIVSANSDQGIIKAAQAVSTGILRPNRVNNLSIVDQVNTLPLSADLAQPVDRTLSDLGYPVRVFEGWGRDLESYVFSIPPGVLVSTDSYFELVYGHSSLLDYDNSQIVVYLNDQPIGSVRLSDETAALPKNKIKFIIPASLVTPGENRLDVIVNMTPVDECAPQDIQGLWVNIWPESILHLPQIAVSSDPLATRDLANYPAPFSYDPILSSTAFVLERQDSESWRNAIKIAQRLGGESTGQLIALKAFYGDELASSDRSDYNLLIVGRPSQLPVVMDMNPELPAPFDLGVDIADESNSFRVTFLIPPDSPMGYIEMLQSPWNTNNVVLAILGNTNQGVNWATTALTDSTLNWKLGGNFAVINDKQVLTADSPNLGSTVGNNSTSAATPVATEEAAVGNVNVTQSPISQPQWILPAIIFIVIVLVIIVGAVVVGNILNNRARNKGK